MKHSHAYSPKYMQTILHRIILNFGKAEKVTKAEEKLCNTKAYTGMVGYVRYWNIYNFILCLHADI